MKARIALLLLALAACEGPIGRELSPQAPGLNVADAALRGGSPQVALQVASGVLARSPNNASALAIQGDALTMLGRHEAAIGSYEEALRADAISTRAKLGLGRLKLASDPAASERLFLEVLQREPRETTALNNLGIARDLQGHHAGAQSAYRQALGINPDFHAAQVNMALSLAMSGQGDRALPLIGPLASQPGATRKMRHDYAAVLAMSGRKEEAERILGADLTPEEVRQAMAEFELKAKQARP
jgi:Flp pilus assembly protein TadD